MKNIKEKVMYNLVSETIGGETLSQEVVPCPDGAGKDWQFGNKKGSESLENKTEKQRNLSLSKGINTYRIIFTWYLQIRMLLNMAVDVLFGLMTSWI